MSPRVAVVDYGAGNVYSVRRALERAGADVTLTADPAAIQDADGVVFPGQGAAGPAMALLESTGLGDALRERAAAERPTLGVCLGLQLLFGPNEEGPSTGLGLLPGTVERLWDAPRVPHMGWNDLCYRAPSPLFAGVPAGAYVYWAHSYRVRPERTEDVLAVTEYGGEVVAAAGRGALWGVQFHPEKSGAVGLRIYTNFVGMLE